MLYKCIKVHEGTTYPWEDRTTSIKVHICDGGKNSAESQRGLRGGIDVGGE